MRISSGLARATSATQEFRPITGSPTNLFASPSVETVRVQVTGRPEERLSLLFLCDRLHTWCEGGSKELSNVIQCSRRNFLFSRRLLKDGQGQRPASIVMVPIF